MLVQDPGIETVLPGYGVSSTHIAVDGNLHQISLLSSITEDPLLAVRVWSEFQKNAIQ